MGAVMSKTPLRRQHGSARGPAMGQDPPPPTRGVTIVSGANIPRIDLTVLFGRSPDAGSEAHTPVEGAVLVGGAAQAAASNEPAARSKSQTVALTDGTRITFASTDWVNLLESA